MASMPQITGRLIQPILASFRHAPIVLEVGRDRFRLMSVLRASSGLVGVLFALLTQGPEHLLRRYREALDAYADGLVYGGGDGGGGGV